MRKMQLQFDQRLIGLWSRGPTSAPPASDDVRILFKSNFSGRYETWHNGLNEVITFNWSPPSEGRVTLAGLEYLFREDGKVRREPCDWHFEAVPYSIECDHAEAGNEKPVLCLQFGPQRIDRFALMTTDLAAFDQPAF